MLTITWLLFCLELVSYLMSRYLSDLTFTTCPLDVAVVATMCLSQHIVPTSWPMHDISRRAVVLDRHLIQQDHESHRFDASSTLQPLYHMEEPSRSTGLSVEAQRLVGSCSHEQLIPVNHISTCVHTHLMRWSIIPGTRSFRKPFDSPEALLTLCLRRHAFPPLERPDLRFAVV
jgi:hypothetical protein